MLKKERPQRDSNFPFYMQNESLLLQFMLHEFLLTQRYLKETPRPALFKKLIGDSPLFGDLSGFKIGGGGSLRKLAFYSLHMNHHFPEKTPLEGFPLEELNIFIQNALQAAMNCQSCFNHDRMIFEKDFRRLNRQMKKASELLFKRLCLYRHDENILLFLLRRSEELSVLFNKPLVASLFNSFFERGFAEASEYLLGRYEKRGFHYLLPKIHQDLESLQHATR